MNIMMSQHRSHTNKKTMVAGEKIDIKWSQWLDFLRFLEKENFFFTYTFEGLVILVICRDLAQILRGKKPSTEVFKLNQFPKTSDEYPDHVYDGLQILKWGTKCRKREGDEEVDFTFKEVYNSWLKGASNEKLSGFVEALQSE